MSKPIQSYNKCVLLALILGLRLSSLHLSAQSEDWHDGIAFVTSITGSAHLKSSDGSDRALKLHTATTLENGQLVTGSGSKLVCTLSNNVSFGLLPNTLLDVNVYSQRPYSEEKVKIEREPSVSKLTVSLETGACVLSVDRISPLSEIRFKSAYGEFSIHRALVYVQADDESVYIDVLDGTLTYYFPGDTHRYYLNAPTSVRISQKDFENKDLTEALSQLDPDSDLIHFANAISQAYKRVLFSSQAAAGLEAPVPVVKPDYYKRPYTRPYGYLRKP